MRLPKDFPKVKKMDIHSYRLNCVPFPFSPPKTMWSPTPHYHRMVLLRKKAVAHLVKVRSCVPLIWYSWCHCNKNRDKHRSDWVRRERTLQERLRLKYRWHKFMNAKDCPQIIKSLEGVSLTGFKGNTALWNFDLCLLRQWFLLYQTPIFRPL